jgi:hypothetical protein
MNIVQAMVGATGKFLIGCNQRWERAVQDARNQQYTGTHAVSDLVSFWADAYEMWTLPGTAAVPSIMFSFTVLQAKNGAPQGKTVVVQSPPGNPTVTVLERVGGGNSVIKATAALAGDQLTVNLSDMVVGGNPTNKWGGANLDPGLYVGVVYLGTELLANVIVHVE